MKSELKVWELALYKLAQAGSLTLDEAKTLKSLWTEGKRSLWDLEQATGLELMDVAEAMKGLHAKGAIRLTPEGYEVEAREKTLVRLIDQVAATKSERPMMKALARAH